MRITIFLLALALVPALAACGDSGESAAPAVDGGDPGEVAGDTGPADVSDTPGDTAITNDVALADAPDPGDATPADVPSDLSGDTAAPDIATDTAPDDTTAADTAADVTQVLDGAESDVVPSPDADASTADAVPDLSDVSEVMEDISKDSGMADMGQDAGEQLPPWACTAEQPCTGPNDMCFGPEDDFCGVCMNPVSPCDTDATCVEGMVCGEAPPCSCTGQTECMPACILGDECGVGKTCDASGHCEPAPCASGEDCPANFACTGGACVRMSCAASSECDDHCVKGKCHGIPGNCSPPPP